jgi:hypothetical protein
MNPDAPQTTSLGLSGLLSREHNFEAVFRVAPSHHLVAVRSRTQGGATTSILWEHEEYDTSGRLVARYKSFEHVNAAGESRCGWQKFDTAGQLLDEG